MPESPSPADGAGFFFVLDEPARLLVADDDPILREFACVHLGAPNVTIDVASNGAEALALMRRHAYDLALVDLDMPVLDGFGLIEQVRADVVLEHTPIVVITGREDMMAIDRAFQRGATSFVVKPLNWRLLSYQLRYVLRAKRQEQEVRAAKLRAEQALAFKANVLRVVQHELRTPLTSIIGFAEQIEADPKARKVSEYARHISQSGRAFAGNVADIIQAAEILTQPVVLRRDDVRVRVVIDAVVKMARDHGAREELRGVDATDGALIECDRALLVRALYNLVDNAIVHGAPPVELVATKDAAGAVSFVVRDRGKGVTAEQLAVCFEPFQQTDNVLARLGGGIGLGLSVARRVIEAHGGTLALQYRPEVGNLAVAKLPADCSAAVQDGHS